MSEISNYYQKYIKYKSKYLELQANNNLIGGAKKLLVIMLKQLNIINCKEWKIILFLHILKSIYSEPWFTLISMGLKNVEGRKNKGKFKEIIVGDIIEWIATSK